jgi:hypothetical protein
MTTYTATFAALAPHMPDEDHDFWAIQFDMDEPYTVDQVRNHLINNPAAILEALGEARAFPPGMLQHTWEGFGLFIDDDAQTVTFTVAALEQAFALVDGVFASYDDKDAPDVWGDLGLGGDDCVDYWGGYLQTFLDICAQWLRSQGVTVNSRQPD